MICIKLKVKQLVKFIIKALIWKFLFLVSVFGAMG